MGFGEKRYKVYRDEIKQSFANAGCELDGSFPEHLIIGFSGNEVSILAHKETWGSEDPVFEILDHERMFTYWVREIPTPQRARELLMEYGRPAEPIEEELSNPYKDEHGHASSS